MPQLQDKLQQLDMDAENLAQAELQNWGKMIRCQPSPFPAGYTASPMFRNVVSRYRDKTPTRESYVEDRAVMTMEFVNLLINKKTELLALYCYYAENHTHNSTSLSLKLYNNAMEKRGETTIGESSFRKILRSVEIQIGTAYIIRDEYRLT